MGKNRISFASDLSAIFLLDLLRFYYFSNLLRSMRWTDILIII